MGKTNRLLRNTDKQNPNLAAELIEEIPGILNFAIEGLAMLRKLRTFPDCLDGMKMREELRTDCDHERTFLQEKTQEAQNGYIPTTRLYDSYKSWMSENGYRAVGMSNFQKAVRRIYPTSFIERRNTDNGKISVFSNISFQF